MPQPKTDHAANPSRGFTGVDTVPKMAKAEFLSRLKELGEKPKPPPETEVKPVTLNEALAEKAETATPDQGIQAGETPTKPKTLKDLAELAKLELKDLFSIEFQTEARDGQAVGKTHTLGELKDLLSKSADFETRTAEFEESRVRQENELLRARQEVQAIVGTLPRDAIKPEVLERVRAEAERHKAAEAERLLEAIPEWSDDSKRLADRTGMLEHLAEYGFGSQTLDGLVDHRLIKFIRDSWQRWDRMKMALAKVKEVKTTPKHEPSRVSAPAKRKIEIPTTPAVTTQQLRDRFRNLG